MTRLLTSNSLTYLTEVNQSSAMDTILCLLSCSLYLYCCKPYERVVEVVEPQQKDTSALIFLHGAGESGPKVKARIQDYIGGNFSKYPNTRFIFPTAHAVQFHAFPWNGQINNLWYSLYSLSENTDFNVTETDESADDLTKLIEEQVSSGIPHKRICLAGHSAGGIMSIYYGYGYMKNLGCIGALSGFLPTSTGLYRNIVSESNKLEKNLPPLYLYAGGIDVVISPSWTKHTGEIFKSAGAEVTYDFQWASGHFMTKFGVDRLLDFVKETIDKKSSKRSKIESNKNDL